MSFKDSIQQFIVEEVVDEDEPVEISHDDLLIERGIIDSMAVMQIVTFLEEETGLRIPDAEVTLENFESVRAMDAMVARLRAKAREHDAADG